METMASQIEKSLFILVETMACSLVDFPDLIDILLFSEDSKFTFKIKCHPEDKRRLIGKEGRLINSMRTIVHCSAAKHKVKTDISLVE
jgi:uncharacterized protein